MTDRLPLLALAAAALMSASCTDVTPPPAAHARGPIVLGEGGSGPQARPALDAHGPRKVAPRHAAGADLPSPEVPAEFTGHLLWQNLETGDRGFWQMAGPYPVSGWMPLTTISPDWKVACTADFDGDAKHDILWHNTATGDFGFWLLDGTTLDATRGYIPLTNIATEWSVAGCADIDADGKPDLMWRNATTGDLGFWFMQGTGPKASGWTPLTTIAAAWEVAAIADFSSDGKPDILWQNLTTGDRGFWLLDGAMPSTRGYVPLTVIGANWRIRLASDANADGQSDILWHNTTTGERGWWYLDGTSLAAGWTPMTTIATAWDVAGILPPTTPAAFTVRPQDAIASDNQFGCAITDGGALHCWGSNTAGQLGNGTKVDAAAPVPVTHPAGPGGAPLRFTQVTVSSASACALAEDGRVFCWGHNLSGLLGTGDAVSTVVPTAVNTPVRFKRVSLGRTHACAIDLSNAAWCWGNLNTGYAALGTPGTMSSLVPVRVAGDHRFASISVGYLGTCALTGAGAAWCWGSNISGMLGMTQPAATPVAVHAGYRFKQLRVGLQSACGITTSDVAHCWGRDDLVGVLGTGSFLETPSPTPLAVAGGITFGEIRAGSSSASEVPACGVAVDGTAYCWGTSRSGSLGSTATVPCAKYDFFQCSPTPIPVQTTLRFTAIAPGFDHVCAITTTKEAYCWGGDLRGQLGAGVAHVQTSSVSPTKVVGGLVMP